MLNILFDMPLRWQKVKVEVENYRYLPEWAKDSSIWLNQDGRRLILIADRPPEAGSVLSCLFLSHKERSKAKSAGIVLPDYPRLLHRVIKVIGQRTGVPNKSISQMIGDGEIPHGDEHAGGQGKPDMYGEDPARSSIVMPRHLKNRVQAVADNLGVPFNRLVVTLIEVAESGEAWDGETLLY